MPILPITKLPTASLHKPSRALTKEEILSSEMQQFIADMIPSMYAAEGIGLAAPQVARNVQVCIIGKDAIPKHFSVQSSDKDLVLINPTVERKSRKKLTEQEGCLSVPGKIGPVQRMKEIQVDALNDRGEAISFIAKNYFARVIQHEVDHLNGILYIDRAISVQETE